MVLGLMFVTSQQGTPSRGSSTSSSAELLRQGETRMYLPTKASRARVREAGNARRNRAEILKAWSQGQVSRRDLIKMGVFTAGGALAFKNGLSPFAPSAYGAVPTGFPRSPLFNVQAFSQPMPRFDVLPRNPVSALNPAPLAQVDETKRHLLDPRLEGVRPGDTGPNEGRPPGPIWAHQEFTRFAPKISIEATQEGAKANTLYNPGVTSNFNSGINAAASFRPTFHPGLPDQGPLALWTFNGTLPPKLMQVRYGDPVLFRHRNLLPFDVTQNGGFGRHTISIHEHNGHHGAENDGFTGAFFFPGQFYDYHYPIVLAGWRTINPTATDPKAGGPNDAGGVTKVPGDWHETMSTHWFHDHMFSFTAQNVYKGMAGMFNIYSALDRGNETINDGVNLRLPSGTLKSWGNLEYDVNLMLADKAWDANGQLHFDIFDTESGFVADVMTVNLLAHEDGTMPSSTLSLAQALLGSSSDPCVGKFLEFRIVRGPTGGSDPSQVPATLIPNPDLSAIPVARTRTFVFGDGATQNTNDPVTSFRGPWGIGTDGGEVLDAEFGRISAAPGDGTREIWDLVNDGGDWDHPVHIHFEEGQILKRNGSSSNVPAWEKGRKDVYRLRPDGSVQITMQFRDFGGMFMEHCHNTLHEDNAMLLRWEIDNGGAPFLRPLPTPIPTPQGVTFEPPTQILNTAF